LRVWAYSFDNIYGKSFGSGLDSNLKMEFVLEELKTRTRVESDPESNHVESDQESSNIKDDEAEYRPEPLSSKEEDCHPSPSVTKDESPAKSIPSLACTKSGDTASSSRSTNTIDSYSSVEHFVPEEKPRPLWEAEDDSSTNRLPNYSKRLFKSHSCARLSKGVTVELFVPPINHHRALLKKQKKNTKRERKTAVGAVGGMVAGCLVLGPVGVVLGAALGGYVTRQVAKKAEKLSQRRKEQESVQNYATSKSLQWEMNDDSVMLT